ncbi:hypothetical protein [Nonomuraea gerenzanensis]|uniref:Uncharacterized protein n=1 Tax=Nonomuraea gerenzanensis TaxID=93944 RepID=A0A1M4EBJ6_9ACTN|nr:hypothetical protein [Nonomuraea gerenzanensis]UBU18171.1 hypothetical protein LCN96_25050 [Nonomuraea gerenzanensis]SBO95983.1 hypothetical protein BN4615_P5499 [Nonomuraea gerenzanensis]
MKKSLVALLAGGALAAVAAAPALATPALAAPALSTVAKTTLGPYGYGAVKLGMSATKARATGRIVLKQRAGAGPCSGWNLKAHPAGKDRVGLYISKRVGVAVILAQKGMRTPQGIGLGSSARQVKKAYPKLRVSPAGISYVTVPGNPKAYYAFLYTKGNKVRELAFGLNRQDCVN